MRSCALVAYRSADVPVVRAVISTAVPVSRAGSKIDEPAASAEVAKP